MWFKAVKKEGGHEVTHIALVSDTGSSIQIEIFNGAWWMTIRTPQGQYGIRRYGENSVHASGAQKELEIVFGQLQKGELPEFCRA